MPRAPENLKIPASPSRIRKPELLSFSNPILNGVRSIERMLQPSEIPEPIEIVRMSDLIRMTKISKSMLYLIMNPLSKYHCSNFPAKVCLTNGGGIVGWYRHEVEAWLLARPRKAA